LLSILAHSLVGNEEGTFPTQKAIGEGEGSIELSEERRLCYVAMTRAKTHLVMTWRKEVSYFAGNSFKTKDAVRSRFLNVLVSKPDDKARTVSKTKSTAESKREKSPAGTRMFHTEAKSNKDTPMRPQSSTGSWQHNKQQTTMNSGALDAENIGVSIKSRQTSSPSSTERKSWDSWEPSQVRKSIDQVPSIKPMTVTVQKQHQRVTANNAISMSGESSNNEMNNPRTPIRMQPSNKYKQQPTEKEPTQHDGRGHSDIPDIDSTIFYPVGSYVRHKFYGKGVVQAPPMSDVEFAEKMLVRVKFVDETGDWDLPMDSLVHTYE
jgi:ATP-dependent exoDNAse (exonuclease V) beta subunit